MGARGGPTVCRGPGQPSLTSIPAELVLPGGIAGLEELWRGNPALLSPSSGRPRGQAPRADIPRHPGARMEPKLSGDGLPTQPTAAAGLRPWQERTPGCHLAVLCLCNLPVSLVTPSPPSLPTKGSSLAATLQSVQACIPPCIPPIQAYIPSCIPSCIPPCIPPVEACIPPCMPPMQAYIPSCIPPCIPLV